MVDIKITDSYVLKLCSFLENFFAFQTAVRHLLSGCVKMCKANEKINSYNSCEL